MNTCLPSWNESYNNSGAYNFLITACTLHNMGNKLQLLGVLQFEWHEASLHFKLNDAEQKIKWQVLKQVNLSIESFWRFEFTYLFVQKEFGIS